MPARCPPEHASRVSGMQFVAADCRSYSAARLGQRRVEGQPASLARILPGIQASTETHIPKRGARPGAATPARGCNFYKHGARVAEDALDEQYRIDSSSDPGPGDGDLGCPLRRSVGMADAEPRLPA